MAAIGRLADEDAGGGIRSAKPAAARAAAIAYGPVDGAAASGGTWRRHGAGSKRRVRGLVADAAAAIGGPYAGVTGLNAIRSAQGTVAVGAAEARAALSAGRASVAGRLAAIVERLAGDVAFAAAARGIAGTRLTVRGARHGVADLVGAAVE